MDQLDVDEELQRLMFDGLGEAFTRLRGLKAKYGDLQVLVDDKGRRYYCSREANPHVDKVEYRLHNDKNVFLAWTFFRSSDGGILYSNPPCHLVGHHVIGGFGIVPLPPWKEDLRRESLSEAIIKDIDAYLQRHKPIWY